jgi:hypothetical protein
MFYKVFGRKSTVTICKYFFLLSILLLSGCINNKKSTKSAAKFYESFLTGNGTIQYFIRPIHFYNDDSYLLLDITFRYKSIASDSVSINISFFDKIAINKVNSITLYADSVKLNLGKVSTMFVQAEGKKYHHRYSTKITSEGFKNIFSNNNWKISVVSEKGILDYEINKKTKKIIGKLNSEIFEVSGE